MSNNVKWIFSGCYQKFNYWDENCKKFIPYSEAIYVKVPKSDDEIANMENMVFSHYEIRTYWDDVLRKFIKDKEPIFVRDYDAEEAELEAERRDYEEQTWD